MLATLVLSPIRVTYVSHVSAILRQFVGHVTFGRFKVGETRPHTLSRGALASNLMSWIDEEEHRLR